jgi:hypothetical protein
MKLMMKRALIKLEFRDCFYLAFYVDKVSDMLVFFLTTQDKGFGSLKD